MGGGPATWEGQRGRRPHQHTATASRAPIRAPIPQDSVAKLPHRQVCCQGRLQAQPPPYLVSVANTERCGWPAWLCAVLLARGAGPGACVGGAGDTLNAEYLCRKLSSPGGRARLTNGSCRGIAGIGRMPCVPNRHRSVSAAPGHTPPSAPPPQRAWLLPPATAAPCMQQRVLTTPAGPRPSTAAGSSRGGGCRARGPSTTAVSRPPPPGRPAHHAHPSTQERLNDITVRAQPPAPSCCRHPRARPAAQPPPRRRSALCGGGPAGGTFHRRHLPQGPPSAMRTNLLPEIRGVHDTHKQSRT